MIIRKIQILMDRRLFLQYKQYINDLFNYMKRHGYTKGPAPSIVLNDTEQDCEEAFIRTGYYDPEKKSVTVFCNGRAIKDVLRSCAHEFIHHKQNVDGVIAKTNYTGDKITEDKALINLEEEAYLKGNMGFRSWTEDAQKNRR